MSEEIEKLEEKLKDLKTKYEEDKKKLKTREEKDKEKEDKGEEISEVEIPLNKFEVDV